MQRAEHNIFVRAWEGGRRAYRVFASHRGTTIAGTLVFFLIMSLVPFLFWLTLLFGQTGSLLDWLSDLALFGWASDLIAFLRDNAAGATAGAGIFLLATTLWSSSAFFYHLRRSGEIVYAHPVAKGWRIRLGAIAMTFALLLCLAVAGGVLVGVGLLTRSLSKWVAYPVTYVLLFGLGVLVAWLLNLYVCPVRPRARKLLLGSLFTSLAWLAASAAFSLYLTFTDREKLYGALALVIVFFLWLYWLMICFVAGVIFNKHIVKKI